MFVIDRPPPTQQLAIDTGVVLVLTAEGPRLVFPNEVDHSDTTLEMPVCRDVLVVTARGAVVDET